MISKKTAEEIDTLKEAGAILAKILRELGEAATPGTTTLDLDDIAMTLVEKYAVEPVLLGYHPTFAAYPYPAAVCISVNNCVQHGIPSEEIVLHEGDVVNIDMSIAHKGMIVDSGITVGVGEISEEDARLLAVTKEALALGIAAAQPGNHIGDISHAIQTYVEANGFSVVEVLCGHGVG